MNSKTRLRFLITGALAAVSVCCWMLWQYFSATNQYLSVKPPRYFSDIKLEPVESYIGVQTHLPFQTLIKAAELASNDRQHGTGERQTCKKILGAKVCATLQWQYEIYRDGEVEMTAEGQRLQLSMPISFKGKVSLDGTGGKLFGLRNKDIGGKLKLIADLDVTVGSDWCPVIDSKVSYQWISDPKIRIVGDLRVNLRKSVDKALRSKLAELQGHLTQSIDCEKIRSDIEARWQTQTIKISSATDSWLHLTPVSAAASDIAIDKNHIRLSAELGAMVELLNDSKPQRTAPPLPVLQPYTQSPGTVEFSLLVEIPYSQVSETLSAKLAGNTYGEENSITVDSIDVYPSGELLTIDVGFNAKAAGNLFSTSGNVYISSKPVANPANNTIQLAQLELTRKLDSRLMSALTTVLRDQLLTALQKESIIDLSPSLKKIESSIADSLADPAKTAGVEIIATPPEVRLMALNPQAGGVAAILHLSTQLDATLAESVLVR